MVQSFCLTHSFTHSFTHLFTHSFTHSFTAVLRHYLWSHPTLLLINDSFCEAIISKELYLTHKLRLTFHQYLWFTSHPDRMFVWRCVHFCKNSGGRGKTVVGVVASLSLSSPSLCHRTVAIVISVVVVSVVFGVVGVTVFRIVFGIVFGVVEERS